MSLYNLVHGVNPVAGLLLKMLGIDLANLNERVGRFRDCYLHRGDDGQVEIHVFTRNGGGNRDDYIAVTMGLRLHPNYLRDFDDDFDCTYATYAFAVPEPYKPIVASIVEQRPDSMPKPFAERFAEFMTMEAEPDDPDVKRVLEAMRPTLEKVIELADPKKGVDS